MPEVAQYYFQVPPSHENRLHHVHSPFSCYQDSNVQDVIITGAIKDSAVDADTLTVATGDGVSPKAPYL